MSKKYKDLEYSISSVFPDAALADIIKLRREEKSWEYITKRVNKKYKLDKSAESVRHAYRRHDDFFERNGEDLSIQQLQAIARTKRSSSKNSRENRIILEHLNEMEDFKELFLSMMNQVQFKLYRPKKAKSRKKKKNRTLIAQLSDMHFGAIIEEGEMAGLNKYDATIAARRTALLVKQLCDYKRHYRKDTELVLVLNGDIIAGIIHAQEHGVELLTTQFAVCLSILSQAISYLASDFPTVRVECAVGNHERMQHKADKGRSLEKKWDSFATMIYVALRERFKEYSNVEFNIPESPFTIFEAQGHKMYATHGDTVFTVGSPGKKIDMASLTSQVNTVNSSDLAKSGKVKVFLVGHVHTPTVQLLDNGIYIVINGCMSGLDEFANGIGIYGNNPTQTILEATEKHPVGDFRFVQVKEADEDESLDEIITPLTTKF